MQNQNFQSLDISQRLQQRLGQGAKIIAVASGKGGVGKSTVALNIARMLIKNGLSVGLLDGDIYGPSLPHLLKHDEKPSRTPDGDIQPLLTAGLWSISMGYFLPPEVATIWRGPMVIKALKQFLFQVAWPKLDCLIIDMPPGTGDVHLTLAQATPLSGAVIVSTPQDLAYIDAQKAMDMFIKVNVPLLGLVENMCSYTCPHCDKTSHPFGTEAMRARTAPVKIPLLGQIPLSLDLHHTNDTGTPLDPKDSPSMQCISDITDRLWYSLMTKKQSHQN